MAGKIACFFPYTLAKNLSQTVHRFGFMRLALTPIRRNGIEKGPRSAIGTPMFCQQALQIMDCEYDIISPQDPLACHGRKGAWL